MVDENLIELNKILSMSKRSKFLYSLYLYNGVSPFFITDLERYFGWTVPQQDIRKVVSLLINVNVIVKNKNIKGDYNYKLNKPALKKLLRNCDIFSINGKLIESTVTISNY